MITIQYSFFFQMSSNSTREASHAGSWYESDGNHLDHQLSNWLSEATQTSHQQLLHLQPSHDSRPQDG